MGIINIQENEVGQSGIDPSIKRINTSDTVATVTTSGYLNDAIKSGLASFKETDMCLVSTRETPSSSDAEVGWFEVHQENGVWSLLPPAAPGEVVLPTAANRLAHFTNTTGTLSSGAADVSNLGDLELGDNQGTEGSLLLRPNSANTGGLRFRAAPNSSDTELTITNDPITAGPTTATIPNTGTTSANFLLDQGPNNILAHEKVIGAEGIIRTSSSLSTVERVSPGLFAVQLIDPSPADDFGIDVTEPIRIAAAKGFRLNSFRVSYIITGGNLITHDGTLHLTTFTDGAATSTVTVSTTGSLATATSATPYLTTISVDSPLFLTTINNRYAIELTVNPGTGCTYILNGIVLVFEETVA